MDYIRLMRPKHYVKNLLVFIPIFFNGSIFDKEKMVLAVMGFLCFCLISSSVYVLNDIQDVEKDRLHSKKKNRPIASGRVSIGKAYLLMIVCFLIPLSCTIKYADIECVLFLVVYAFQNVGYSMGLKNYPIVDVVILASGFVVRVLYGGVLVGIPISKWLYLIIVTGSLYMGLGKRRNESKQQNNTREVLKFYTEAFLDKNMYVAVALVIVFYSLWSTESLNSKMIWTVPFFIIILMKYSFDIEGDSDGDPVEVITHDWILMLLVLMYGLLVGTLIYLF